MNDRTTWIEADFGELSWHDCQINAIALDHDGDWQSDLVFHLDFITRWVCGSDGSCRFEIAPAVLRFTNVDNLRLDVSLKFRQPLDVKSIDRSELPTTGYRNFRWTITVQHYPGQADNVIEFDATGFTQELTGEPIQTDAQHLTDAQRKTSEGRLANEPIEGG